MEKNNKNSTQKYTNARLMAVQAIYTSDFTEENLEKTVSRFIMGELGGQVVIETDKGKEEYISVADADMKLFTKIMDAYAERRESIDETIQASLENEMTLERLELVLKCILRAGIAEFYANPKLDAPIIINEYTDIARSFYDGPEVRMVNAILDRFGKIIKS